MYSDSSLSTYGHLPVLFGLGIVGYVLFSLGQAIYNVTLHPLAGFPGPKLWGAFYWPNALSGFRGWQAQDMHRLHEKYGPVVRIEPWSLSSTDPRVWKDVYGSRPGKGQMPKYRQLVNLGKAAKLPKHIIIANDADHSRFRRVLSHAFSDQALRAQEDILNAYFQLLVNRLGEEVEGPRKGKVDLVSWYNFATFDIIGDLAFGESFAALEGGRYHPWIENTYDFLLSIRWLRIAGMYAPVRWLLQAAGRLRPGVGESRNQHFRYTDERIERRMNLESERKDFMTYILRHNDEKGMSRDEILSNVAILMIAGTETTATLLSGVTYHLLRNPDKMARLQKELREAFTSVDEMTLAATNKLPYLHAVIEEGLRMYPPVPGILPRKTPPEGAMVADWWVPGGTVIGVHQYSAYHDKHNFRNPNEFVPERFLPDAPAEYADDKREVLQPFSYGPRNCIGKNLAYHEMRSILGRMAFQFDLELPPGSENWLDHKAYTLWAKPQMMVQLHSRKEE